MKHKGEKQRFLEKTVSVERLFNRKAAKNGQIRRISRQPEIKLRREGKEGGKGSEFVWGFSRQGGLKKNLRGDPASPPGRRGCQRKSVRDGLRDPSSQKKHAERNLKIGKDREKRAGRREWERRGKKTQA